MSTNVKTDGRSSFSLGVLNGHEQYLQEKIHISLVARNTLISALQTRHNDNEDTPSFE